MTGSLSANTVATYSANSDTFANASGASGLACTMLAIIFAMAAATPISAAPTFWVMPGYDVMLDQGWQAAVGTFYEIDFDSYSDGGYVSYFTMGGSGGVTVTPSLPGAPTTTGAEIFYGHWDFCSTYGNVFEGSPLTRTSSGWDRCLRLDFSQPVYGFGVWILDNGTGTVDSTNPACSAPEINHFQMAPVAEPSAVGLPLVLGTGLLAAGGPLRHRGGRS